MVKMSDVPPNVVGPKPKNATEFAAQNKRIADWYDKAVMKEIEDAANQEGNDK